MIAGRAADGHDRTGEERRGGRGRGGEVQDEGGGKDERKYLKKGAMGGNEEGE